MSGFRFAAIAHLVVALYVGVARADFPLTGVTDVAAGFGHSCALTTAGGVLCWGLNTSGELGNGTATAAETAVAITELSSGVIALALGGIHFLSHSCALSTAGGVKCWGNALGNGTGSQVFIPAQVPGMTSGVAAIAAGGMHTCVLTSGGGVKCWGLNDAGQLGNGTTTNAFDAVDVSGLASGVIAITAGQFHTCALTSGGGVKCWGENFSGQVGNGTRSNALTPVDVTGLTSGVVAISAGGFHSCAVTSGGGVKCWGENDSSQLGNGTSTRALTPTDVTGLNTGIARISGGGSHTCALTTGGGVKCWGGGVPTVQDVPELATGVTSISAGYAHTCARTVNGSARCWGSGFYGQVGNGWGAVIARPVGVLGLFPGATAITAGSQHTCALTNPGAAKCWGDNSAFQLGNGASTAAPLPVGVSGLSTGTTAITAGGLQSCALTSAGGAKCWGYNNYGEVGNGTTAPAPTPVDVTGLGAGVAAIATGGLHTCALTTGGGVKCWGVNGNGEVGNGTTTPALTPVDVAGLGSGVTSIAAGQGSSCAVTAGGGAKCWGGNAGGQLGNGSTDNALTPVDVSGLTSGVAAIGLGSSHACALTLAGGVKCWGSSYLGDGTMNFSSTPVDVSGLGTGTAAIATGSRHTCALTRAGSVKCWGSNAYGQIGRGDTTSHALVPTDVAGLGTGVVAIAAGDDYSCAILNGGGAACWGYNLYGQLGNGAAAHYTVPQAVVVAACADMSDVDRSSAFCPSVEWMRNRAVTQGCVPGVYCADAAVNRLAMAAFMQRLGTRLTQAPDVVLQAVAGLDPDAGPVVCATSDVAPASYPRRVLLDGILSAIAAADSGLGIALVSSVDAGTTWHRIALRETLGHASAARWINLRTLAQLDIASGQTVRFALAVGRGGLVGTGPLSNGSCRLGLRTGNRSSPVAPY